jgi:hypothetical protein
MYFSGSSLGDPQNSWSSIFIDPDTSLTSRKIRVRLSFQRALWHLGDGSSQSDLKSVYFLSHLARCSILGAGNFRVAFGSGERLAMLFFYLPLILFEACLLSPPERKTVDRLIS